jgi:hypothetical protein
MIATRFITAGEAVTTARIGGRRALGPLIALLALLLCAPTAFAATVYVNASASGTNAGTSWTNA